VDTDSARVAPALLAEVAGLLGARAPRRGDSGFGVPGGEWMIEPRFTGFSDPPPATGYCLSKGLSCLRDEEGRMSCVEIEIARRLAATGWSGGWLNTYGGDPPSSWLSWARTPGETASLMPVSRRPLAQWLVEGTVGRVGGLPDVVAVRGDTVIALECKRAGGDRPKPTQIAWLRSAIVERAVLHGDDFAVVSWARAPAPVDAPTVPPHLEPTRKYPHGRPIEIRPAATLGPMTRDSRTTPPPRRSRIDEGGEVHTERSEPTEEQRREATAGVALRGWERADAKSHAFRPIAIRDGGIYLVCEHCHARTNPARWPLFFRSGEHAGRLLWTCSTCKRKQADRDQAAVVLVSPPL